MIIKVIQIMCIRLEVGQVFLPGEIWKFGQQSFKIWPGGGLAG